VNTARRAETGPERLVVKRAGGRGLRVEFVVLFVGKPEPDPPRGRGRLVAASGFRLGGEDDLDPNRGGLDYERCRRAELSRKGLDRRGFVVEELREIYRDPIEGPERLLELVTDLSYLFEVPPERLNPRAEYLELLPERLYRRSVRAREIPAGPEEGVRRTRPLPLRFVKGLGQPHNGRGGDPGESKFVNVRWEFRVTLFPFVIVPVVSY